MTLLDQCRAAALVSPARLVFPDSLDARSVRAAFYLAEAGYAQPVLLGNPFEMRAFCHQEHLPLGRVPMIDPQTSARLPAYIAALAERMPGKSEEELATLLKDPLWFAGAMLMAGDVDCVVGGNHSPTSNVLRAALRVVGLAEGNKTVSSIFFMLPPDDGQPLVFTDCGVVPNPTPAQLSDIAISAADSYRRVTGLEPHIAMLSFSTLGSARHASVDAVREATRLVRERRPDLSVDGELQFDAAMVPEVAAQKAKDSPVAGRANVLVFPSLEAGNIGYKIAQRMGKYTALGPMIQGLRLPYHDLSRGCTAEDMVQVSLLAMKMAQSGDARSQPSLAVSEMTRS